MSESMLRSVVPNRSGPVKMRLETDADRDAGHGGGDCAVPGSALRTMRAYDRRAFEVTGFVRFRVVLARDTSYPRNRDSH